jgi:urea carboxylase-associated protein 2
MTTAADSATTAADTAAATAAATTADTAAGAPSSTARATHETGTVLAARADARAQAGIASDAMPYLPASSTPFPPPGVDKSLLTWAETVAPGNYTHKTVARGTRIRLTDVAGEACAHVLLFNAGQPAERLNVADTVKIPWQAYLGEGHPLLSGDGRVLATIVSDEADGHHDAFCGTTTAKANDAKYGPGESAPQGKTPAGRELFVLAAAKHGLTPRDLPPGISFFKGVRIEDDGGLTFTGSAGPGKSVELLAELPLVILVANVPHPADPRPAYTCGPLRVHAWRGQPTGPGDPRWNATPETNRAYLNTADYATARGL